MWSVIGHDQAVVSLQGSLAGDRPAHAYLITGPAQIGKTRLALDFARALNCHGPEPPCGNCRACNLIEAGRYPDVETVSVGGLCDESEHDHQRDSSKDIKICQVRRLQRVINLRPFEGRTRVIIIEPADALNVHAADALLKTLEEPPDHVVLMLVAASAESLLETIRSRCRQIALSAVPRSLIATELAHRGIESEQAELLARLSGGRLGWALAGCSDSAVLAARAERLDRLEGMLAANRADRLAYSAELATRFGRDRQEVYSSLLLWQSWWRDLLLIGEGCEQLITNADRRATLIAAASVIPAAAVVRTLQALRDCRQRLEENVNARLALDVLVLRIPSTASAKAKEVEGRGVASYR